MRPPGFALRLPLALALVLVFSVTGARAQLNDAEQRIVAAVKERSVPALTFLERTVRVNSGTLNADGVREVGKLYRAELDNLGFATKWVDMPADMHRAGHLIATRDGARGKRLLLLGHMDTVFESNSKVVPWDVHGDRVRGQGVTDMKGGNVILLEALRALRSAGVLDGAEISVMLTGDEERMGRPVELARADLIEIARRSDAVLSFEGNGPGNTVAIARRSAGGWALDVTAKPGHSSRVFTSALGYGAVFEAARILNAFRETLIESGVTFNPGVALGGTTVDYADLTASGSAFGKSNVIAKKFSLRGDLRYLTPEQGARVKQRMREIVGASLPGTSATIQFTDSYPPMPPTDDGRKLLEMYSQASLDAGLGPARAGDPDLRGAGDVQHAAPFVAGIDGLGARGSGAHTDDEDLEMASIERGAIRAALLIHRLTRQ
ncbi:MAG: M20/M25/M40 family metallo-hydrolase [Casimicrobiaceae bacterium]